MADKFDLIILGSGPSASRVAPRCAQQGWRVGVVDSRPIGGICALHGCNPKKVLVRAAELIDWARRMDGLGVHFDQAQIKWADLMAFKRTFTDPITEKKEESFRDKGIEVIQGNAQFTDRNRISINGRSIEARHFLIATGATPIELPIAGSELLTDSDEFLELDELPQRIVFVGGGFISFEFAHVAVRAGAEVTIIERSRPLKQFDSDLVEHLVQSTSELGIDVQTETTVERIERQTDGSLLVSTSREGGSATISADLVVHGAGRVPNVNSLDLQNADVKFGKDGIDVNEFLQSVTNPAVYAAGDVVNTDVPPLSPVASQEGRTVATNLLTSNTVSADYGSVPAAVFSVPALAAVGHTERQARELGLSFEVRQGDWSSFNSMRKVGAKHAYYKVLIEKESGKLLGAHLLGPDAAETINLFAFAMKFGHSANELKSVLMTFPTFAADIRAML